MFLAGKVEERGKRVSEIVNAYFHIMCTKKLNIPVPGRDSPVGLGVLHCVVVEYTQRRRILVFLCDVDLLTHAICVGFTRNSSN